MELIFTHNCNFGSTGFHNQSTALNQELLITYALLSHRTDLTTVSSKIMNFKLYLLQQKMFSKILFGNSLEFAAGVGWRKSFSRAAFSDYSKYNVLSRKDTGFIQGRSLIAAVSWNWFKDENKFLKFMKIHHIKNYTYIRT